MLFNDYVNFDFKYKCTDNIKYFSKEMGFDGFSLLLSHFHFFFFCFQLYIGGWAYLSAQGSFLLCLGNSDPLMQCMCSNPLNDLFD